MKWIKNKILLPARKKDWNINLSSVGKYQLIEVTDPKSRWNELPSIYMTLLGFLFKDCQVIALSQYIDENQWILVNKEQMLVEISQHYGLRVALSKDYTSAVQPLGESKEYVLNVLGKPTKEWLRRILVFGGASLSNIIYGVQTFYEDWLEVTVERNQTFTKYYWLEIEDGEFVGLREKVNLLCWTSDSHLNVLSEENKTNDLFSYIEEVANQYSLIVHIEGKNI
jgi:hypothetical protein